uniref:LytR/AlgR family response regulator transcription factor n=1 Tax=Thomasclavelia spiroformis TaxID=29348 RepID=UPI00241D115A
GDVYKCWEQVGEEVHKIGGITVMRIGICDDNPLDLHNIKKLLDEYINKNNINASIHLFHTIDSLFKDIHDLDCLILDVLLSNNESGIKITKKINLIHPEIKIIFCSTNPEYSIEAFEVNGFRYLVKPINKAKMFEYLDDVRKYYNESIISFRDIKKRERRISVLNICYIEMDGRKSHIHLKNHGIITMIRQMKEWQNILENQNFYISHKGIYVNIRQVFSINENMITLKNGETVYMSRLYKNRFINAFYSFLDETI